jgi:hypothetical protein
MHGDLVSYFRKHTGLVSYFSTHTDQASSFGGCMALVSYLDPSRCRVSFLAKKARFVTTSNVRSCHKASDKTRNLWRMIYRETEAMIRLRTPGGDTHYSRKSANAADKE